MRRLDGAISALQHALLTASTARLAYKRAHAHAVLAADGKNAETRAAQAELSSFAQLEAYELAKVGEVLARAEVDYLIAHGEPLAALEASLDLVTKSARCGEPEAVK